MSDALLVTHLIRQLLSHYFLLHQLKVFVLMRVDNFSLKCSVHTEFDELLVREALLCLLTWSKSVCFLYGQVLCEDVTKSDIEAVLSDLLDLYDMEAKCV